MVDGAMASAPKRRGTHGFTMVVTNMRQKVVRTKFKYKALNQYNHSSKMTYEEFLKLLHLYTDDEDSNKNDEDKGGQNGK
jgi:hypothetical protein